MSAEYPPDDNILCDIPWLSNALSLR